jgi:hypothetical protein
MARTLPVLIALLCPAFAAQDGRGALLFRAALETSLTAGFAAGDPEPLVGDGVRLQGAAQFPPNARLTYDARANLYAEQGTVSFWWRPDQPAGRLPFPVFLASYEQHSTWDFNFARIGWTGSQLAARVRDRNLQYHTVNAPPAAPPPGRWMHIALAWSESGGVAFYLDGKLAGRVPGPLALDSRLDQFGFLSRAVTPHHTSGNENPGSIRDVRIYNAPLDAGAAAALAARRDPPLPLRAAVDWAARFGWSDAAGVPTGASLTVRRVPLRDARDLGKFWLKGADGKRETSWPMVGHGYAEEGKRYRIRPEPSSFNYVRTTGNLDARIGPYDRSGAGELHYHRLLALAPIQELIVERRSGALGDLELLHIDEEAPADTFRWIEFAPAAPDARAFAGRRDPSTFDVWRPVARGRRLAGLRYHYLLLPAASDAAAAAVRLRIASTPGAFYYAAVEDGLSTAIEADVRAAGSRLDLTLDFPDCIVPAGGRIVVVLASSSPKPMRVRARVISNRIAAARPSHVSERLLRVRDSFQTLSEARPWMTIGRQATLAQLRRRLKLVDELYALLEDVRRVEPANEIAAGYWGWINRAETPPPYQEPPPPAGVPLWAHRQLALVRQFRDVVDWWVERRQIETGEFGGGLGDDTDMIQNWPAVALLDGPAPRVRDSVRRVLEACYRQGMIERGMNRHRTDALHAYEEGMNAYGPAFLLDYGNPVLFERMLETASHYPRLTGVNAAGHRHFRSYQYSATDLVEEGYHAREDIYSHLILHPGLYVAWYNGQPQTRKLLAEFGASLLAHWRGEKDPALAKGIFFADDRVEDRASPNTETWNLLWGLSDIEQDSRYLWLLREAVKSGDLSRAAAVNAPWPGVFEPGALAAPLAADAGRRNIHDHNLQTDQGGLVARVLAWQAGGDRALLEDGHAALVRHMAQNLYLYTEAEQFTDRIWIPTLSVQRERLGGVAHYRNHIYPGHAVSWENTGGEVAALVPEARPDRLRLLLFHAGAQPRTVTARVWQLEHGLYELVLRGETGAALETRRMVLKRYAPVAIELPPGKTVTAEFRRIETRAPLSSLPDLAIAAEEVPAGGPLAVPVHNIGAAPSRPFTLTVRDPAGKVLAEARHDGLPGLSGYRPQVVRLRIPELRAVAGLQVSVVQMDGADEICDQNNRFVIGE